MDDKQKITRERYAEAVRKVEDSYHSFAGTHKDCLKNYVNVVMEAFGITVEPPPILPGVTPGKGDYRQSRKHTWEIFVPKHGSIDSDGTTGDIHIGWVNSVANALVMAGAKELVELVVAKMKRDGIINGGCRYETQVVLDQLKTMGVDLEVIKDE